MLHKILFSSYESTYYIIILPKYPPPLIKPGTAEIIQHRDKMQFWSINLVTLSGKEMKLVWHNFF